MPARLRGQSREIRRKRGRLCLVPRTAGLPFASRSMLSSARAGPRGAARRSEIVSELNVIDLQFKTEFCGRKALLDLFDRQLIVVGQFFDGNALSRIEIQSVVQQIRHTISSMPNSELRPRRRISDAAAKMADYPSLCSVTKLSSMSSCRAPRKPIYERPRD